MATFANMSINDGQTTPVSHPFTIGKSGSMPDGRLMHQWLDFSVNSGIPIGANRIEMYSRMPVFGYRAQKTKGRRTAGDNSQQLAVDVAIILPTLEVLSNNTSSGINPQPTWAYDTTCWFKVVRNGRAAAGPVKDALAFMRNFSQQAQYTDAVLNYAPPTT